MNNSQENYEGGISLRKLFRTFVKNIVLEIIIAVFILCVGIGVVLTTDSYYVVSATVAVKANTGNADGYVDEICELSRKNVFLDIVRLECEGKTKTDVISENVSTENAKGSLFITFSYTDGDKTDAKTKLSTLVEQLKIFLEDEDHEYFGAQVTIDPVYSINNDIVSKVEEYSSDSKILLATIAVAVIAVVGFVLIANKANNTVFDEKELERIVGKKNFATISKSDKKDFNVDVEKLSETLIWHKQENGDTVYQIQSAKKGEGKTTVVSSLARALGESYRKVLVVDCDFNNPCVHTAFNLPLDGGITDSFGANTAFEKSIKRTSNKGVDVLVAGKEKLNNAVIFTSSTFKDLIDYAKSNYDFVLIDTPSVGESSNYVSVCKYADATILVVKKESTKVPEIKDALTELQGFGTNVVGTVFNFETRK